MFRALSIPAGKAIRQIARVRGGGSALPGLVVERVDPHFMKRTLDQLPYGVVMISGTNGKTTTTKMVVELLESHGLTVFTNRTGSNFTRGIVAALIAEVSLSGNLKADVAVLELDEAHAVHFVRQVQPKASLLLNVMRDQLDRFGEIDYTARLLATVAKATTDSVVINREDPRLLEIGTSLDKKMVTYYGLDSRLRAQFPSDDELHSSQNKSSTSPAADVVLQSIDGKKATFSIDGSGYSTSLKLDGLYNIFNAAGALALARTVLGTTVDNARLIDCLATISPAFGRGETIMIGEDPCELVLVKNPSGFRLGLASFSAEGYSTMIAINDAYADGRDMSWLWDVDFSSLKKSGVTVVSGTRGYDMSLRLDYDHVAVDETLLDIPQAVDSFVKHPGPKRIYCTYTAMLAIRQHLGKITKVERVL